MSVDVGRLRSVCVCVCVCRGSGSSSQMKALRRGPPSPRVDRKQVVNCVGDDTSV